MVRSVSSIKAGQANKPARMTHETAVKTASQLDQSGIDCCLEKGSSSPFRINVQISRWSMRNSGVWKAPVATDHVDGLWLVDWVRCRTEHPHQRKLLRLFSAVTQNTTFSPIAFLSLHSIHLSTRYVCHILRPQASWHSGRPSHGRAQATGPKLFRHHQAIQRRKNNSIARVLHCIVY